jgi:uncharacterized protein (TIGR00730 family)
MTDYRDDHDLGAAAATQPHNDDFVENPEQTQESAEPAQKATEHDVARAKQLATDLVAELQHLPSGDLVGDMIDNALKLLRDQTNRGDMKLINKAFKEIRYALRVFAPYRDTRKVSIFGSARTPETDPDYAQCAKFATGIVNSGWMVITGAGGGIMAAGHAGAGPEPSFGLAIRLPFEQATNAHIARDKKLINFKYFFTRKLMFVRAAHAVALFPGGFGTLDEGFEVMTLVQTGKSVPLPIVFVDRPGGTYWKGWMDYAEEHLLGRGFIGPADLRLFKVTDNVDDAIREITHFYSNYHSVRTVKDELVMRLTRRPTDAQLADLTKQFADISTDGQFRVSGPLPQESDEPALNDLHRLVFRFNRRDHGRLRILIDHLNVLN